MIEFENVSFSYQGQEHDGLHGIDLKIADGECVLFCGRSGCGKTTITRLVNGLIPQFYQGELQGRVLVDGQEISNLPMYQIAAKVGSVFQNPRTQFFNVDTDSEIAFGIENEARPPKELAERVEQATDDLNIQKLRNRNIFELSGGEKQKIAFASVYAMNPEIYLLDEPSSNLDMTSIQELAEHLRLIKSQGKTILIAEHRLYYLMDLADRIVYLEKGKITNIFTPEEFLLLMRAKGYEIKGETFGEDAAKYISFRPLDKEHFVRGSARSLGKEYTKKRIRERIEKKRERKAVIPKKDYSSRKIIDTSDEKFQNSPGLQQWAAIENLKIAAQSYNEAGSLSDLEHKITVKNEAGKSAKQSVVELEHRMKNLAEIIKYAEQYKDNRSYHIAYKKAKNPDAYFRRYESQIILYGGARRMLEQAGIKLKGLNVDKLRAEYQALETQKKELTTTYKSCEKEVWNLKRKQENLNRYLGRTQTDPVQEQQTKNKNHSL